MAYAFKGNSFKSYNYRPYHWVGAQGGGEVTYPSILTRVPVFGPSFGVRVGGQPSGVPVISPGTGVRANQQ